MKRSGEATMRFKTVEDALGGLRRSPGAVLRRRSRSEPATAVVVIHLRLLASSPLAADESRQEEMDAIHLVPGSGYLVLVVRGGAYRADLAVGDGQSSGKDDR